MLKTMLRVCIEFYNKYSEIENIANLDNFVLEDIYIELHDEIEPFGIIKLKRNAQTKLNDKGVQTA